MDDEFLARWQSILTNAVEAIMDVMRDEAAGERGKVGGLAIRPISQVEREELAEKRPPVSPPEGVN